MSATTVDPASLQAQETAIEASGVAERFHLLQLRNPAFWVLAWGVVVGAVRHVTYYQPGTGNFGGALAAGFVSFGIYLLLWLVFLHWMDRYTPVRPGLLGTGFLWGAFAATLFLAQPVNVAMLGLYGKLFGTAWVTDWGAGATAPLTEETSKVIGFVLLLGLAPRLIRSTYDAFIVGAFIGLGFEVSEDVIYVYQGAGRHFATEQVADSIQVIALRSASGLVSHAAFSAIVCCGVMWILGRDPRGHHVGKGLALIVTGMILHGCWDVAGALGVTIGGEILGGLMIPILLVIGITLILVVGRDASGSERVWARAILAPEVERGTLAEPELDAVCGTHRDRRRFIKSAHGHHKRRVAKHVVEGARELGAAIGRASGREDGEVAHAREELARLRRG